MSLEPLRPLRSLDHGGRQVGILVWTENGTWRSAWRLEPGAWHSLRGTHEGEEEAADAASRAAQDHLASGRSMPRRGGRGDDAGTEGPAPSPGSAVTSEGWRARHMAWTHAQAELATFRDSLTDDPDRQELDTLRRLESRAEDARRAMEGQLSRILRPQRRRPGVPRDPDPGEA
ncbi:MAG: hypothetical protein J0H69_04795 [Burkholderiales bacterium]|jgi:hypothetical protein|nr:hypothetical protein [Burkholderiales bacterium]